VTSGQALEKVTSQKDRRKKKDKIIILASIAVE